MCFALSDGATFSNEGRGYVLRRLVRRMARQAQVISVSFEDLINLVDIVVDNMKHFYPYLIEKRVRVKKMLNTPNEHGQRLLDKNTCVRLRI